MRHCATSIIHSFLKCKKELNFSWIDCNIEDKSVTKLKYNGSLRAALLEGETLATNGLTSSMKYHVGTDQHNHAMMLFCH